MKLQTAICILILFIISGCGAKGASSTAVKLKEAVIKPEIDIDDSIDGQYLAVFQTLNPLITNKINGAFTFSREKEIDELVGDVRITNAGADLIHAQSVRVGRQCPTMVNDLNEDGIIDAYEGELVYGKIFIPLDGDLSSQSSHDGEFPKGDIYGNYIYSRVTKYSSFMKDLRNTVDHEGYVKLNPLEPLEIEGRVVVVHGVDEAYGLPSTVRSVGRAQAHQSLPIVCGIIKKVNLDHLSGLFENIDDFSNHDVLLK
jgi:hypothetical protein